MSARFLPTSHPHRRCRPWSARSGMSFIDVIVGIALLLVVFLALFGIARATLLVSAFDKASATATSLASVEMEYLRGLSYDSIGTVGGIPAGVVPQTSSQVQDGITYTTSTFISYVDDPADGTGASDTNHITTDYKRARVAVSYAISGQAKSVVLVSDFAPPGIETTGGGGTLEINVVSAAGAAVPNAVVHIVNASTSPTVDLTTLTNTDGQVYLPGAATSSQYQVSVSRSGYSSAQTYAQDASNPNPNPGFLTVVKDQTTAQTFAIDQLATLNLATYLPVATSTFADTFTDASKLAAQASTTVSGGELTLTVGKTDGIARSIATSSPYLVSWGALMATSSTPANTYVRLHVYDASGNLLPDTALPGNSTGFTTFPVSLEHVSTTTYPSLAIGAELSTTGSDIPDISAWSLSYTAGPVPLGNVAFTLTGTKTIGTMNDSSPIYKTIMNTSTGSDGTQGISLEWDSYALRLPNYDLKDACPSPPYALSPGDTIDASLFLGHKTTNSLRVVVTDSAGAVVPGATVTLSRGAFTETAESSACGSAYFGGLAAHTDYAVSIAKSGYTTASFTGVGVSGASTYGASFP